MDKDIFVRLKLIKGIAKGQELIWNGLDIDNLTQEEIKEIIIWMKEDMLNRAERIQKGINVVFELEGIKNG